MAKTKKAAQSKAGKQATKSRAAKTSRSAKGPAKSKPDVASANANKAMRLTFSYSGDEVKLVSQQRTDMLVPPTDPVKGFKKQKGFWAELKNERDKTLYRHVLHNPTRNDAEVFSEDPEQSISREAAPKRKGVFVVVVPDTDKGDAITLSRSSPERKGPTRGIKSLASKPATEILRVKLKK